MAGVQGVKIMPAGLVSRDDAQSDEELESDVSCRARRRSNRPADLQDVVRTPRAERIDKILGIDGPTRVEIGLQGLLAALDGD